VASNYISKAKAGPYVVYTLGFELVSYFTRAWNIWISLRWSDCNGDQGKLPVLTPLIRLWLCTWSIANRSYLDGHQKAFHCTSMV